MIYITGDTHGRFERIEAFCKRFHTTKEDILIILGDAGINYFNNRTDKKHKEELQRLPIRIFCIHGNHEIRPENLPNYSESKFYNGIIMKENEFPDIMFAKDGELYDMPALSGTKSVFVCGGAYSVDKYYRMVRYMIYHPDEYPQDFVLSIAKFLESKYDCHEFEKARKFMDKTIEDKNLYMKCGWWKDEQPSAIIKEKVKQTLDNKDWNVDYVLTHTCPLKYEPTEAFLSNINQSCIDKSTEIWLDELEKRLKYKKWYCGHYHIDKKIDNTRFLFESFDLME